MTKTALVTLAAMMAAAAATASAQVLSLERVFDQALLLLQDGGGAGVPPAQGKPAQTPAPPAGAQEGSQAALVFERSYRGPKAPQGTGILEEGLYPQARPIPFADAKNIVPLTEKVWTRRQVIEDFHKNKAEGQVAIMVLVKTELCCSNKFRACAVATAALEKRSTPLLKKFRVYGAWINNPQSLPAGADDKAKKAKAEWDGEVALEYAFDQGSGAKILILDPVSGAGGNTNAAQLELTLEAFEREKGRTPRLERALELSLKRFEALKGVPPRW